jgi:HK97 family phage portal protein
MAFPEIRRKIGEFFAGRAPISLNLKTAPIVFNSTAERDFLLKYPSIMAALAGGLPSWSNEVVTRQTILQHPVHWACNGLVTSGVGLSPALLMRGDAKGKVEATDHPMYEAMRYQPNDEMSSQSMKETLTSHCALAGGGFAKIIRRSGTDTAIELNPLLPEQMGIDREKTGQKRLVYIVKNEKGAVDSTYTIERNKPHDIFHLRGLGWNGIQGYSVIEYGKQSIGTAIAANRNLAAFWASGGRLPSALEFKDGFKFRENTKDAETYRREFMEIYRNPNEIPFLLDGARLTKTGISLADAQSDQFQQRMVAEQCRWWKVSPTLVGDASRATFNNQEQYMLQFVKMTLTDWFNRWEQDFRRCVLTAEERAKGHFLRFDIRELLRGDFAAQMAGYATALQNGYLAIDEVRDEIDYNPLPNGAGSHYHIQLNQGTIGSDGQVQAPAK